MQPKWYDYAEPVLRWLSEADEAIKLSDIAEEGAKLLDITEEERLRFSKSEGLQRPSVSGADLREVLWLGSRPQRAHWQTHDGRARLANGTPINPGDGSDKGPTYLEIVG